VYGQSWVEEGQLNIAEEVAQSIQDEEREIVSQVLLESEDNLEVKIGDIVKFADVTKPQDIVSVQITGQTSDPKNGLISEATPLAQALFGATLGDEVLLQVRGVEPRTLRVVDIKRPAGEK
jgi:transcription elongation GreA/GreB family factor